MRARMIVLGFVAALAASAADAHGPQMQITNDNGKIVTREVFRDSPYETLSTPKSVYVMPMVDFNGVWHSQPNGSLLAGLPEFPSGPGFSFGYDQVVGGERKFAAGSIISVEFVDGFKLWDGATFVDAGATQLKGFRGSNPAISSPAENFAVTSDAGPFDSLSLAAVSETYNSDAHASLRWALLGDGMSPTSASPNGVFLLSMKLVSTQQMLAASDAYYFVLHKNATPEAISAAVGSLGLAADLIQVVPEPCTALIVVPAGLGIAAALSRTRKRHNA